jgi:hypothetical protein
MSRIFSRSGMSVPLILGLLLSTGVLGAMAFAAWSQDPLLAAVLALGALWLAFMVWLVWRRSHVRVSNYGVAAGFWRTRWLEWPDIARFSGSRSDTSSSIIAETVDGREESLCGIYYQPLLLDSRHRHDRAVERILDRLEEERRKARFRAG